MTFGVEGTEGTYCSQYWPSRYQLMSDTGTRVSNLQDIAAILDVFQAHGHNELDTARVYAGGTSEEVLGELGWKERGLLMETKLYPVGVSILRLKYGT